MVLKFISGGGDRVHRVLEHRRLSARLIVDETPFVAGSDIVGADQHVAGAHDEGFSVAGGELVYSGEHDYILQFGSIVPTQPCLKAALAKRKVLSERQIHLIAKVLADLRRPEIL